MTLIFSPNVKQAAGQRWVMAGWMPNIDWDAFEAEKASMDFNKEVCEHVRRYLVATKNVTDPNLSAVVAAVITGAFNKSAFDEMQGHAPSPVANRDAQRARQVGVGVPGEVHARIGELSKSLAKYQTRYAPVTGPNKKQLKEGQLAGYMRRHMQQVMRARMAKFIDPYFT